MITQETDFTSAEPEASARTYRERLNYWAIVRLLPDLPPAVVGRFRSRSDADGHLQILTRHHPDDQFVVMFDQQHKL